MFSGLGPNFEAVFQFFGLLLTSCIDNLSYFFRIFFMCLEWLSLKKFMTRGISNSLLFFSFLQLRCCKDLQGSEFLYLLFSNSRLQLIKGDIAVGIVGAFVGNATDRLGQKIIFGMARDPAIFSESDIGTARFSVATEVYGFSVNGDRNVLKIQRKTFFRNINRELDVIINRIKGRQNLLEKIVISKKRSKNTVINVTFLHFWWGQIF